MVSDESDEQEAAIKRFISKYPMLMEEPTDEIKKRREEFLSGIVDEKPTPAEAHALAVYIKALETGVAYYTPMPRSRKLENIGTTTRGVALRNCGESVEPPVNLRAPTERSFIDSARSYCTPFS